ncbi:MAG: IS66 family insertion sequence element accessory protein TnpB [Ignavibacteriaceae bacterium]|nr:IS66 family insertion sequence element accessory protein TnpB [Ignavibacteriaceae bacterium]
MLALSPQLSIFAALQPIDFRKGIDGLIGVCRQQLLKEPLDGALFLFQNRARTAIKALCFDGQGFWLFTKRLSTGKFNWWPKNTTLDYRAVQVLFSNGNPDQAQFTEDWRPLGRN